jgi:hypothetical protein
MRQMYSQNFNEARPDAGQSYSYGGEAYQKYFRKESPFFINAGSSHYAPGDKRNDKSRYLKYEE